MHKLVEVIVLGNVFRVGMTCGKLFGATGGSPDGKVKSMSCDAGMVQIDFEDGDRTTLAGGAILGWSYRPDPEGEEVPSCPKPSTDASATAAKSEPRPSPAGVTSVSAPTPKGTPTPEKSRPRKAPSMARPPARTGSAKH